MTIRLVRHRVKHLLRKDFLGTLLTRLQTFYTITYMNNTAAIIAISILVGLAIVLTITVVVTEREYRKYRKESLAPWWEQFGWGDARNP